MRGWRGSELFVRNGNRVLCITPASLLPLINRPSLCSSPPLAAPPGDTPPASVSKGDRVLYITRDRVTLVPATVMVVDRWGGQGRERERAGEREGVRGKGRRQLALCRNRLKST